MSPHRVVAIGLGQQRSGANQQNLLEGHLRLFTTAALKGIQCAIPPDPERSFKRKKCIILRATSPLIPTTANLQSYIRGSQQEGASFTRLAVLQLAGGRWLRIQASKQHSKRERETRWPHYATLDFDRRRKLIHPDTSRYLYLVSNIGYEFTVHILFDIFDFTSKYVAGVAAFSELMLLCDLSACVANDALEGGG